MITINGVECWPSRGVASLLQIGRNLMMARLRRAGILNKFNFPTDKYRHIFVVRDSKKFDTKTTYWTSAAIDLTRKICSDLPRKKNQLYKESDFDQNFLETLT